MTVQVKVEVKVDLALCLYVIALIVRYLVT
jgi:hypothetical protein